MNIIGYICEGQEKKGLGAERRPLEVAGTGRSRLVVVLVNIPHAHLNGTAIHSATVRKRAGG